MVFTKIFQLSKGNKSISEVGLGIMESSFLKYICISKSDGMVILH